MTIDRKFVAAAALLGAMLSGCTPNDITLGAAANNMKEAQIIEPDPKYAEAMTASGDQTAGAQDRYRKGTVKKPVGVKTTDTSSSSN